MIKKSALVLIIVISLFLMNIKNSYATVTELGCSQIILDNGTPQCWALFSTTGSGNCDITYKNGSLKAQHCTDAGYYLYDSSGVYPFTDLINGDVIEICENVPIANADDGYPDTCNNHAVAEYDINVFQSNPSTPTPILVSTTNENLASMAGVGNEGIVYFLGGGAGLLTSLLVGKKALLWFRGIVKI